MSDDYHPRTPISLASLLQLICAVALAFMASMVAQAALILSVDEWYIDLIKPTLIPPHQAFPLIWSLLYALMALALWRVLRIPPQAPGRRPALIVFLVQVFFSALWPWVLFGFRNPIGGLIAALVLVLVGWLTLLRVWQLDRFAGLMLIPPFLWAIIMAVLSTSITVMN